jgi:tRNA 5-methylaminomethyl-2-thiouridine biosynthesis bifunctional protein
MKTASIVPAEVDFSGDVPFAPAFADVYHARAGAFHQAREVFLAGNQLPARWRGRQRFVILETGFGLGNNFLATWAAWRADPQRAERLVFISIEKHPLRRADMARAHTASPEPALAAALFNAWPPLVPGLHSLDFDDGRVTLLLAFGDAALWLTELQASVDAVYLDGFAPAHNAAMWDPHTLRALTRLAAPGATAATWSAARSARDGLASAGFRAQRAPGFADKREITVAEVETGAVERRRGPPAGRQAAPRARSALVVGAGLAGAAAARALARQGLDVTVLEAALEPAAAGSGNPAGLFHGIVHGHDGLHAQWLRAAALRVAQVCRPLIETGRVPGEINGLLRGVAGESADALRAIVENQSIPPDYAQALSRAQAAAMAHCPLAGAAWCFPDGGWLQPGALALAWLQSPGVTVRKLSPVASLVPMAAGGWCALGPKGDTLAEADVAVVAAAHGAPALLSPHSDAATWPWRPSRGQITVISPDLAATLPRPSVPIASGGYLIALPASLGGGLLCGATSQPDDDDPAVRGIDHRANLAQIDALTGMAGEWADHDFDEGALRGRVSWRLGSGDRLPLIGGVPLKSAQAPRSHRMDQPRHIPRVPGLYVLTALGSRGITWAALAGEVLAACIVGAPVPVAGSLLDAVDPARFAARQVRRSSASSGASDTAVG